jgi:Pectate lyase superfamily protein
MKARMPTVRVAIYPLLSLLLHPGGSALAQSPSSHAYEPPEVRFPADAGMINVKTEFGAQGDGHSDDTAAIRAAIEGPGAQVRVLYFPKGTYLVSNTLNWLHADKTWRSELAFQGENERDTVIRLKNHAPSYQDPGAPKAVIRPGSIDPYNQKDGSGNNGVSNYIFDLTVDTGSGNPGAIGIDYLGNNFCGLENVTIRTSDPQKRGVAGLEMTRKYVGPCYYRRLTVTGFDTGIVTADSEYSHTLEHVALSDQRVVGIENSSNVLSIRDLKSQNSVPALRNKTPLGLVTLIDSNLTGGAGANAAIENEGGIFLRRVSVSGYSVSLKDHGGVTLTGAIKEFASPRAKSDAENLAGSLDLAVEEAPEGANPEPSAWLSVVAEGADSTGRRDSTQAIQSALDSDAPVVYFPVGVYQITDTINIRKGTKRLLGPSATLVPHSAKFADAQNPAPVLRFESQTADLAIEGLAFGNWMMKFYPGAVMIEDASPRTLTLRHTHMEGDYHAAYATGNGGTGRVFIEDVGGGPWFFHGPQKIWARQLDMESLGEKAVIDGAQLWVMGVKTERPGTVIRAVNGAALEVLGGLLYPLEKLPPDQAAFVIHDARASLTYAVEAFEPGKNYAIQVEESKGGKEAPPVTACTARGYGCFLSLYRVDN